MADLTHISRLLEQGKVTEARAALAPFPRRDDEANRLRRMARNLILRKCQRQAKAAEFLAEGGSDETFRVAGARLGGTLSQFAAASPIDSFDGVLASLASVASGDLRAGLARLRRATGCAELAHGWMAVLRGDLPQAAANFASAPAAERKRARCGLAVVAALSGKAADVEQHLAGLGPFPHTAFPAIAGMLQQVTKQRHEHGPAQLAEHLRGTTSGPLQRVYEGWPKAQAESKAWLALHLGDVRWVESEEKGDQRAIALWHDAARLHPSLQADVLKRLLLAFVTLHEPAPGTWRLHKALHQRDAGLAQRVVDTVTADWPASWCVQHLDVLYDELGESTPEKLPVELVLMRFRALEALPDWEQCEVNPNMKQLRPIMDRCDATYGKNSTWLKLKLDILRRAHLYGEQRKTCFAALITDPSSAAEILPLYLSTARRDARAKRQVSAELKQLNGVLGDDADLAILGVETGNLSVAAVQSRWPGPIATAILLVADHAKASDLSVLGHDEALDMLACMAADRLKKPQLDQLLKDRDRLHRLLRRHQRRFATLFAIDGLFDRWKKQFVLDWRPWFHAGAFARIRKNSQDTARAWNRAIALIPREAPEHAEIANWLNHNQDMGFGGFDGDFADDDSDDSDDEDDFTDNGADGFGDPSTEEMNELRKLSFAEFEQKLNDMFSKRSRLGAAGRLGKGAKTGKATKSRLQPSAKRSKPSKRLGPSHPLLLTETDLLLFTSVHGTEMVKHMEVFVPSLGIPTTTDAAGLADSIPSGERAAVHDWLSLLVLHNNSLHDLSTASAIAGMLIRLGYWLKFSKS